MPQSRNGITLVKEEIEGRDVRNIAMIRPDQSTASGERVPGRKSGGTGGEGHVRAPEREN